MSDGQWTERAITALLCGSTYFSKSRGVVWLPQQRMGCGYGNDFERTIDVFGITTTKPWTRLCVEIKLTRADYLSDIRQALKQRRARMIANQFYYLAPAGVLAADDLPLWAGLAEVYGESEKSREHIRITVEAPWMETSAPTWRFVAQLARRAAQHAAGLSEEVSDG